jgi:hypothetical protein
MADHATVTYATAPGNDLPAHEAMYKSFIKMTKYGTISVIVIMALMAYFLV